MTNTATRGRPSTVDTGRKVAQHLQRIGTESAPSRYIVQQLAAQGYVEFASKHTGRRGRPALEPQLTGRARALLNLARGWN